MHIVSIVASPHKDGLNHQLVQKVHEGCRAAGADTCETMYLADYDITPCVGCDNRTCWDDGACVHDDRAKERHDTMAEADALVFAAPVYILDINGLAKDFIDKVRIVPRGEGYGPYLPTNGKPAMGITVAGGTGKGVLTALQAIYYGLFFLCGYRVIDPLLVTRFNWEQSLQNAVKQGKALVQAAKDRKPFKETGLDDRMAYYNDLAWIKADPIDDNFFIFRLLVEDLRKKKTPGELASIEECFLQATDMITSGRTSDAAGPIWKGYLEAVEMWEL